MNKKYLLAAVGAAGAIGAGVYFREELKEFFFAEKALAIADNSTPATPEASKPDIRYFFSDINHNPPRKNMLSQVLDVDATQVDVYSQINPQVKPEITEQTNKTTTNTVTETPNPSCTPEQPCTSAAKGLLDFCKSVKDKYNELESKARAGYHVLNRTRIQPTIENFSDQVDELAELYLDEEHKARRIYDKTLSNLSKLTPAQLGTLEQELQKLKEAPLTEEEKRQQPYQKCASSLSKLSLEELEKLTGDIAKQWKADDYDYLLRQKELQFWLDSLQRVYGVVFNRENPPTEGKVESETKSLKTEEK